MHGFLILAVIGLGALTEVNNYSISQKINKLAQSQNVLATMTQTLESQLLTSSQNFGNLTEKLKFLIR